MGEPLRRYRCFGVPLNGRDARSPLQAARFMAQRQCRAETGGPAIIVVGLARTLSPRCPCRPASLDLQQHRSPQPFPCPAPPAPRQGHWISAGSALPPRPGIIADSRLRAAVDAPVVRNHAEGQHAGDVFGFPL